MDIESRVLTAPVLLPNTPDCTYNMGEPMLSEEQVKTFAESFNKYGIIDYEHQFAKKNSWGYQKQIGSVIDSWLIPEEETIVGEDGQQRTYPAGTWFLSTRITDPEVIKQYDNGTLKGFSCTTANKRMADDIKAATKSKTLIKDIVDPVIMTVSVTSSPCVYDAKFCPLANKHYEINEEEVDHMENEKSLFQKIGNVFLNLSEDEEETANKNTEEEKIEETAEKADDTNKQETSENKPTDENNDNKNEDDVVSPEDFKQLVSQVTDLVSQIQNIQGSITDLQSTVKDLQDKINDDKKDGDTQETDEQTTTKDDAQGTANKSKQLDTPDITEVASKHSITPTNAVYKAMGRTGPGRSHPETRKQ